MSKIFVLIFLFFCVNIIAQENEKNTIDLLPGQNTIGVTIGGNFPLTGTFPAFITERVDQFITRIYTRAVQDLMPWETFRYTFRNIKLKRNNGEEYTLDLMKFRRTGDFTHNPYLKHDDVLVFPSTDKERNFVTSSGAVMEPGKFDFVDGDRVEDIIQLSGGINKAYQNIRIKVYRLDYNGSETEKIDVSEDFELQRGDRLVVEAEEPSKKEYNVIVVGEVNIPGEIPVSRNNTTLGEVIERAGGLKKTASLKNSRLYTGQNSEYILSYVYGLNVSNEWLDAAGAEKVTEALLKLEWMKMYRLSSLTYEDTTYYAIEEQLRILNEGSAIDFSKNYESYKVKDGDILVIAKEPTTVYLFGSITNSGHIRYIEGKDAEYYIKEAGGIGEYAEDDEVMLIKGNTREWIPVNSRNPVIEAGDYIYIPRNEPRPFSYYVDMTAKYFGILGSVATVVLLLLQLNPNN